MLHLAQSDLFDRLNFWVQKIFLTCGQETDIVFLFQGHFKHLWMPLSVSYNQQLEGSRNFTKINLQTREEILLLETCCLNSRFSSCSKILVELFVWLLTIVWNILRIESMCRPDNVNIIRIEWNGLSIRVSLRIFYFIIVCNVIWGILQR